MILKSFVRREFTFLRLILVILLAGAGNAPIVLADTVPPTAVTLTSPTSPGAAQPGVTVVNLTGTGFPSGTVTPAQTTVTLAPATSGPAESTKITAATLITGTTWRLTFQVIGPNVTSPTLYKASLSGTTSLGTTFASSNTASLTINPPAAITLLNPASAGSGKSLAVSITGQYTNYVNGATRANFGAGISVGGATQGTYGPVTVTSPTTATANLVISPSATPGPRDVTVATGLQQALLAGGFTVINQPPQVNAGTNQIINQTWQLFVADAANHDVLGYNGTSGASAGTFVAANSGGLSAAASADFGPDGRLYDADRTANKIFRYNGETGSFFDIFVDLNPQTATFGGMTFGPDGNIYVGDSTGEQILRYNGATGAFVNAFVSAGSGGLSNPAGEAFGPDGNLYVSSAGTNSVLEFNGTTGAFMATFASGNGLSSPGSLKFAADGSLFVAGASDVRHFQAVNGNFLGVAAASGAGGLTNPGQIRFGPDGNLYVANLGPNNNILRFNGVTGALINTFVPAGTGGLGTPSAFTFGLEINTQLNGTVTDDGFPVGGTLTETWTEQSGPGSVLFSNANVVNPLAFFSMPGGYDLRLTANDGQLANFADVLITANAVADNAPMVSAGPNQQITLPANSVMLIGAATDDGLPVGGTFTTQWSMVTGPAAVTFGNANAAVTTATFTTAGVYDLRLTANDSVLSNTSDVTITVNPPATPVLTTVVPGSGQQGQSIASVAIVGQNTNFVQGTTVASFGTGITINSLTVNSATSATANITVQNNATLGARTVTMTTGAEVASLVNGFTVNAGTATLVSVTPNTGQQGQTLTSVAIVGQNTNFVQGTTVASFGAGITINSLTVNSATSATANITVQNNAALGARTVTMTTGAEVASLVNGFTVNAGTATLVSVTPNTGQQGQTLTSVAIVGQNTNFVQGTTVASFGAGITINSLTVNSATSATANITVQNNAALGARTVTMTTGAEVASLVNGFTVTAGTPALTIVNPNTGNQGQQHESVNLTGQFTHWVQGTSVASFGAGITVNTLTVNSSTTATADISIDPAAALGARNVTVTTGAEVVTSVNGFTVNAGTPALTIVNPNTGKQGQQHESVNLTGQFTHWVQGTSVASFGAGITVNTLTVNSVTTATADISIDPAAALGARNVTVTTGAEVVTSVNCFTVNAGTPALTIVNPNTGNQGQQHESVNLTGQFTH